MKRVVLALIVGFVLLVGAGYAAAFSPRGAPPWAPWCLALGSMGLLMSLMALGAIRHGTLPPVLTWTFAGIFVICGTAFGLALALPDDGGAGAPLVAGLPLRAATVILVVGVVPILVLPFAYALTFDASTLSDEDLRRLRDACAALREHHADSR